MRKFKAITWPHMSDTGAHLPPTWYVVEVNDRDGSYYPRVGPVSKGYAEQVADKMEKEWREALKKAQVEQS